ncbi:MAG: VOC family protein [Chloroflexi bacterium]|nr:VOC family protein [Chloroflexota bacterium]
MTLTLKRIDLVVLFVADLERSRAFYRDPDGNIWEIAQSLSEESSEG